METFSALLAICAGNSPVTGEFPPQRPVTRNFDVFFDLRLNKRLSKHWWGWWFETPSCSLWRHCNEHTWLNLAHLIVFIVMICVLPYWGEIHKGQVVNEFIADSFLILWNFDIRICFIDIYHYINDDCLSGVSGVLFTTTGITHWGYGTSFGAMVLGQQWFRKWWRHQMETFSALLVLCPRNSLVIGEFPAQRPVTRSFGVFFDLHLN